MKVLYLNNPKIFGGTSKSLYELYNVLKTFGVNGTVLASTGDAAKKLEEIGLKVETTPWLSQFDNTRYGFYRGLRWIVLLREIVFFIPSILKLIEILKKENFDLVHINEAPLIIYAPIIKKLFNKSIILHVRSVQSTKNNWRRKIFTYFCIKYVDQIFAIDERVKESLDKNLKIEVVYNGINPDSIKIFVNNNVQNEVKKTFNVGFIGMLYKAKGIYELLDAINFLVNQKKYRNIKLYIAGSNVKNYKNKFVEYFMKKTGFYTDTLNDIKEFIKKYNLHENIIYLGYIDDISEFYNKIDVLCFPSHLDAAGRPVIEAAFWGIPSIIAMKKKENDIVIHNKTGLVIEETKSETIAHAIEFLYQNTNLIVQMKKEVKRLASEKFDIRKNGKIVYNIYKNLLGVSS